MFFMLLSLLHVVARRGVSLDVVVVAATTAIAKIAAVTTRAVPAAAATAAAKAQASSAQVRTKFKATLTAEAT